jgi:hypothetical protein
MNQKMHRSRRGFGGSGFRWAEIVTSLIVQYGFYSMLDYGCGQSTLWRAIKDIPFDVNYYEYDPCIPDKSAEPYSADFVTCTDVLEHIEPLYLDNVLKHIYSVTKYGIFFNIAQHEALKRLPNGKNAHLIVQPKAWWLLKLQEVFHPSRWSYKEYPVPVGREAKDYNVFFIRNEFL